MPLDSVLLVSKDMTLNQVHVYFLLLTTPSHPMLVVVNGIGTIKSVYLALRAGFSAQTKHVFQSMIFALHTMHQVSAHLVSVVISSATENVN
jgi:hypothetical protein